MPSGVPAARCGVATTTEDGEPAARDLDPLVVTAPKQLASLPPAERQALSCILEILAEDQFLTYGLGVSLMHMRSPSAARARVPDGSPA
jgi:hypothetical protein